MDSPLRDVPDLRVVYFTTSAVADVLSRDVESLGYRHRMENGHRWMRRKHARTRCDAHIILVGGNHKLQRNPRELVARLSRKPWICILTGRDAAMSEGLMRASTEFLQSPWSQEELAVRLERFTANLQNDRKREQTGTAGLNIVGSSPELLRTLDAARRAAKSAAPVIIEGETGTGKELIALLVHRLSDRSRRSFVPVNCGCLPAELVENELFGHEAGAYTGAVTARNGLVHQADGGTLFLDEVDTLPPRAQIALLRFLQQGEVRPIGGGRIRTVDVRVMTASNQSLADLVTAGKFREDLYFRLNVLELNLPPLRERRVDIAALAQHFLNCHGTTYRRSGLTLSDAAMNWIRKHDLPGNVRQLDNLIHRAILKANGPRIELADIAPPGTVLTGGQSIVHRNGIEQFAAAKAHIVRAFERRYLTTLMQETGGNVTIAAGCAGKERRALGKLLKKHGLDGRKFR